jgi:hypothetical protein
MLLIYLSTMRDVFVSNHSFRLYRLHCKVRHIVIRKLLSQ